MYIDVIKYVICMDCTKKEMEICYTEEEGKVDLLQ
jgi:hypothetical protein